MKLTKELKQKIDSYFESKSEEEVYEILKGYGLKEEYSYTLDELKSEVDKFRGYLLEVCKQNELRINVLFESNGVDYMGEMLGKERSLEIRTRINIE